MRIAITNPNVKIIWRCEIRISQYLNPKVSSRSIKEREHNLAADECSRKFNSCLLPTCVEVLSALPLSEQIIILHSSNNKQ